MHRLISVYQPCLDRMFEELSSQICRLETADPGNALFVGSPPSFKSALVDWTKRGNVERWKDLPPEDIKKIGADGVPVVCSVEEAALEGAENSWKEYYERRLSFMAGDPVDGCLFFSSEQDAWNVKRALNSSFRVLILWHPHDSHLRYLQYFLEICNLPLTIYVVKTRNGTGEMRAGEWHTFDDADNWVERHDLDGLMPESVSLDAPEVESSELCLLPADAMYGVLAEQAEMLQAPLGFSYLALLCLASVFVKNVSSVRANLYGAMIGNVGEGKSVANDHAGQLLGLMDVDGSATDRRCERTVPASDRGLANLFKEKPEGPTACVISLDEGRSMMAKGSIENSTLISTLCELWNHSSFSMVDKKALSRGRVQLSLLLNLKVKDPSEFPSVFTHYTAHGLYDRFLFAVLGGENWHFQDGWCCDPLNGDVRTPEPTEPKFTAQLYEMKHAWELAGENRRRLAENALRVALVTSAVNRDDAVTEEAMEAALRFMEWQEKIRTIYQPAKGSNEHSECMATVLDAFERAPGHALNWREACRKHNWHRRFPRALPGIKKQLETERVIVRDKESGRHYLTQAVSKERL
jgi:hypothetical protein